MSQVLFVWASPPCNTVSPCGAVNQLRGSAYRMHSQPGLPSVPGNSKYARLARNHDAMTSRLIKTLTHCMNTHPIHVAVENPRSGMEQQWFMEAPEWKALTEKHIVDYCAWKHPYRKSENIWVSEFGWMPKGTTGTGRCDDSCESGVIQPDTGKYRHHKVLSGANGTGPVGPGIAQQKNAVPHALLTEILEAVKAERTDPQRTYVVDFFAGYGSMRAAAKEQGLGYVAVDLKDYISGDKLKQFQ